MACKLRSKCKKAATSKSSNIAIVGERERAKISAFNYFERPRDSLPFSSTFRQ